MSDDVDDYYLKLTDAQLMEVLAFGPSDEERALKRLGWVPEVGDTIWVEATPTSWNPYRFLKRTCCRVEGAIVYVEPPGFEQEHHNVKFCWPRLA